MGAQPKNKITRVERGKRRAGNTPSLKKDARVTKTPLHKQTLMKKFANSSANVAAAAPAKAAAPATKTAEAKPAAAETKTTKKATPAKTSSKAKTK